ncbi:hypothetical protein phiGT1_31 [Sulfitobacter phage phiGT1]|nr:hypothetical protein phiGT1_31 [Sulfitobacter phage phiGT1]
MVDLLSRIGYEPEAFEKVDGLFVTCNGETVLVRCFGGWGWSIVVRAGQFKYGGSTAGYHSLSFFENLKLRKNLRRVPERKNPRPN